MSDTYHRISSQAEDLPWDFVYNHAGSCSAIQASAPLEVEHSIAD